MRRLALLAMAMTSAANAQVRPMALGSDPLQQSVRYEVGQTVILETAPGFQVTVELGDGEQIRTAAAGDTSRWEVLAPTGTNHLFARPLPGAATTNLTLVTNRRTYSFLLVPASKMTHDNPLTVRFIYPPDPVQPNLQVATAMPSPEIKGSYHVSGTASVRPSKIWDDGAKTYLVWPGGVELPAVFAIGPDGSEMLVNGYMRGDHFVIDAVYSRLVFRIDRSVARADRDPGGKA